MNKFTKADLYKFNKKSDFPERLIEKDTLTYKEILYSDKFENSMTDSKLSNSFFEDTKPQKRIWRNNNEKPKNLESSMIESFSLNKEMTFNKVNEIIKTPFNTNMLFIINEKLKIGKNEQIWYLQKNEGLIYGPISSKEVESLYMDKQIDGLQEIRLVDVFKIRGRPSYEFFKLKDLENPNFLKDLDTNSSILKYLDELEKVKNELVKQEAIRKETFSHQPVKNVKPIHEQVITTKKGNKKEPAKPKVEVPINSGPSIIDFEHEEIKSQPKKDNKKKKGKPVDFDLKTGFITVTEQEKNYEPLYICGDLDK
jgi:hypothetical protein